MPVFPVQIINNTVPALTVEVADSGVPSVTYEQVIRSLGSQTYKVNELYLYSENFNQLLGVIQYQRFDSDGNQKFSSIATTVDPYNGNQVATIIDLRRFQEDFVLNGNSSFSTTILPNTYVQVKFWANRVTNSFGRNLENFRQIEIDANKPNFFNNYGSPIIEIEESNEEIQKTAILNGQRKQIPPHERSRGSRSAKNQDEPCKHLIIIGIASIAIGAYIMNKES